MDMILTIIESSTSNKKMDLQLESNNYIPIYTANKTKSLNIDQLYSDLFNIHKSFTVSGFMSSITKQFLDCLKKTRSKTFKISIVGDAMFGVSKRSIFPPFADDEPEMVKSWKKLLNTGSSLFLPSHGNENSREKVESNYIKYSLKNS